MKLLRILTGVHAGAQLRLSPAGYRLGADDDADIRISDWSGADLLLTLDEAGIVRARRSDPLGSHGTGDAPSDDDSDHNIHTHGKSASAAHAHDETSNDTRPAADTSAPRTGLDPAEVLLIELRAHAVR